MGKTLQLVPLSGEIFRMGMMANDHFIDEMIGWSYIA
jgi:hypothetical protein